MANSSPIPRDPGWDPNGPGGFGVPPGTFLHIWWFQPTIVVNILHVNNGEYLWLLYIWLMMVKFIMGLVVYLPYPSEK